MYIVMEVGSKDLLITKEDIDDIMCSALEGGICYWCWKAEVVENKYYGEYAHEQISNLGSLRIYLIEDNNVSEPHQYVLTFGKFLRGIKLYLAEQNLDKVLELDYVYNKYRISPTYMDGNMADEIVQNALFGELVYC